MPGFADEGFAAEARNFGLSDASDTQGDQGLKKSRPAPNFRSDKNPELHRSKVCDVMLWQKTNDLEQSFWKT